MAFKESGSMKERQNGVLPSTSPTQFRPDAVILARELSKAANLIDRPRMP